MRNTSLNLHAQTETFEVSALFILSLSLSLALSRVFCTLCVSSRKEERVNKGFEFGGMRVPWISSQEFGPYVRLLAIVCMIPLHIACPCPV